MNDNGETKMFFFPPSHPKKVFLEAKAPNPPLSIQAGRQSRVST